VAFPRSLISDILLTERRLRLPYVTGCSFKMPGNTPRKKPFNSDTAEAKFSPEVSSSKERLYETLALLRTELIRAIKRLNSLFKGYRCRRSAGYESRRLISSTCASGIRRDCHYRAFGDALVASLFGRRLTPPSGA